MPHKRRSRKKAGLTVGAKRSVREADKAAKCVTNRYEADVAG